MKVTPSVHLLVLFALSSGFVAHAQGPMPQQSARDLVKDVVYNEIQDRSKLSLWEYRVEKRVGSATLIEHQVETVDGPVYRVFANLDSPLTDVQQREERARWAELDRDPSLQAKINQQHEEDQQKLERLMRLLAPAFLFDHDGAEGELIRLKFRPDPSYSPPTYEARVFHGMAGTVWIDARQKRLVHITGSIVDRIDFGFGLLGHIEKGGTFELKRQQVSPTHWKTSLVDVHMTGRAILFKTLNKEEREVRSNFKEVPADTKMQQGERILANLPGPD